MTNGDHFKNDPRIQQAKKLLMEALTEHQAPIQEACEPDSKLLPSYEELLTEAGTLRGRPLYFPYLGSGLGNGPLVELADGSVKYDFISGIGVHVMGHSHPTMLEASIDAALEDTIMQGHLQQNPSSVQLSKTLIDMAQCKGGHLAHCFLSTSGAMANENALKIIFQKKSPAHRVLAFEKCFMGRTLALAQITDKPAFREGLPKTIAVDYIPFYDAAKPQKSTDASVRILKKHLEQQPGEYAAFVFELVQGERGSFPGTTAFFKALMQELHKADVAVFVDEVQTFGRTTEPFAFQHFGIEEEVDVVTAGKLLQVCATIFTPDYNPKPGLLSQTFTGSTASIFASQAILNHIVEGDYFGADGKIVALHNCFVEQLSSIAERHKGLIEGPYGIGAMVGFTAFGGSPELAKEAVLALYHAGVLSFMAGKDPTRIRFLLPYANMTQEDLLAASAIIEKTLVEVQNKSREDQA